MELLMSTYMIMDKSFMDLLRSLMKYGLIVSIPLI